MPAARRKAPPPPSCPRARPAHLRVRAAGRSRPRLSQLRQRGRGLELSSDIPQPPPAAGPCYSSREMSCNLGEDRERALAGAFLTPPDFEPLPRKLSADSLPSTLGGLEGSVSPYACLSTETPPGKGGTGEGLGHRYLAIHSQVTINNCSAA